MMFLELVFIVLVIVAIVVGIIAYSLYYRQVNALVNTLVNDLTTNIIVENSPTKDTEANRAHANDIKTKTKNMNTNKRNTNTKENTKKENKKDLINKTITKVKQNSPIIGSKPKSNKSPSDKNNSSSSPSSSRSRPLQKLESGQKRILLQKSDEKRIKDVKKEPQKDSSPKSASVKRAGTEEFVPGAGHLMSTIPNPVSKIE